MLVNTNVAAVSTRLGSRTWGSLEIKTWGQAHTIPNHVHTTTPQCKLSISTRKRLKLYQNSPKRQNLNAKHTERWGTRPKRNGKGF